MFDPNAPRKPFVTRGSNVDRCDTCLIAKYNCICKLAVKASMKPQFWLLTHKLEQHKPSNTGRLVGHLFEQTQYFTWFRVDMDDGFETMVNDPRYNVAIVFPNDGDYQHRVVDIEPFVKNDSQKIPVFILLDGTWRQARKMFRHTSCLQNLPVVSIKTNELSTYKLRKAASDSHLCTAEVAAQVLKQSGFEHEALRLSQYFNWFNEAYSNARQNKAVNLPENLE